LLSHKRRAADAVRYMPALSGEMSEIENVIFFGDSCDKFGSNFFTLHVANICFKPWLKG
jgi:hypothetical protein